MKRYTIGKNGVPFPDSEGEWVRYDEAVEVIDEEEMLRVENVRLQNMSAGEFARRMRGL